MTQAALAVALDLSPTYVNQLEKNLRPLSVPVLLKINQVFSIDVHFFSESDEARLIADLKEIFVDPLLSDRVSMSEIREVVSSMPSVGRSVVELHRRLRHMSDRADAIAGDLGLGSGGTAQIGAAMPYEQVRDFFYRHHNYFAELDEAAERISTDLGGMPGDRTDSLFERLRQRHGIQIILTTSNDRVRRFDPAQKLLQIPLRLRDGQRAFQAATQLALFEMEAVIERLSVEAAGGSVLTHRLARIGLANYFAGALIMPYGAFVAAAEELRYDIEALGQRFDAGFEAICHRLSSLQRPKRSGVPFFFIRVDRAGNISKRQSATDFHFSRVGGTCPLWNVYEAFAQPTKILTQVAQMPDGRTYLWIARTVQHRIGGYGTTGKLFAVGLGCDIRHASRLVYSQGISTDAKGATPIGAGCKVCERETCPQRAFPALGRPLVVDENETGFAPYAAL